MRFLLSLALFAAAPAFAQNTGKLAGQVTMASDGDALIGANVYLPEIQRGAATDIDGNYTVIGLPAGVYTVQVSFSGLETATFEQVEITAGRTRALDAELADLPFIDLGCFFEPPYFSRDIYSSRVLYGEAIQRLPTAR